MKIYYILAVNCDCGSYKEAKTNLPRGVWGGMRCRDCRKMLGIFEWKVLGKVKALEDLDALRKFNELKEINHESKP